MVLGVGDEKILVGARRVLEGAVFLRDLLGAWNAGSERSKRLGVLLHLYEKLLPFDKLRLLRLERKNVSCSLGKPLLYRIARGAEVVDLVGSPEVEKLLRDLVYVTALLLDIFVRLAHGLVATDLVFLVGVRLNGLGIGVRKRRRELRRLRPDGYCDDARIALEF